MVQSEPLPAIVGAGAAVLDSMARLSETQDMFRVVVLAAVAAAAVASPDLKQAVFDALEKSEHYRAPVVGMPTPVGMRAP